VTGTAQLLESVPFLAALELRDREALARTVVRRPFRRGETVFQKEEPGQSLFVVERGTVRIFLPTPQGNDLTLAVLAPGDFFGDMSLLDGRPRSASAAATFDSSLLVLDRQAFIALISSRPSAAMAVLGVVAQRLRETDEMASDLAFLDVGGRLAKKLLDLAASHGVQQRRGILLDLRLTQEELANMIGVTRESVNRHLSEFRRTGLVQTVGRKFVVLDSDGLRERSEASAG